MTLRVFDAWLDPKITRTWLFTGPNSEAHEVEIDARVGGRWQIIDQREGVVYRALGEYIEIDRPRKIVFTFGMPQFSTEIAKVTVEIEPDGLASVLTVTHEHLPWAPLPRPSRAGTTCSTGSRNSCKASDGRAACALGDLRLLGSRPA